MITLENEELKVTIAEKGAELQSIFHKKDQFDYLWQGAEGYWSKHAPNLFPIVGRLNDNKHIKDGKIYEMNQHGFARDLEFKVGEVTPDTVELVLQANEETLNRYPYEFTLKIHYRLDKNQLAVTYYVENHSGETMPYSLGGHPAFNLPINGEGKFEDYKLHFNAGAGLESLEYFEMEPLPYMSGRKLPLTALKNGEISIDRELFGAGLVMDMEMKGRIATLYSSHSSHSITLSLGDFPYLCLWTEEGMEAPFLCVEPFHGMADEYGEVGELADKKGINLLEAGQRDGHQYVMIFDNEWEVSICYLDNFIEVYPASERELVKMKEQLLDESRVDFYVGTQHFVKKELKGVGCEGWGIQFD